jgi:hypothetical protein
MSKKATSGKARSGGGITSRKLVHPGVRVAPRTTNVVSPSAVADVGAAISYKRQPLVKSTAPDFAPMGNTVAAQTVCGPGGSRTIYKSGFQTQSGSASPGEGSIEPSKHDRGPRQILGPARNTGAVRRGQQRSE